MLGSRSIAVAATVIALAGAGSIVQPASADDGGTVCTASSDCGYFETSAPEVCYWGVYGYIDGTLVIFVDWNSNAKTDPQPSNDAIEYCESGW